MSASRRIFAFPSALCATLLLLGLMTLLGPLAARAQTFSNIQGNVYQTTGSGSNTNFGAYVSPPNPPGSPVSPGVTFYQGSSYFGLAPYTAFAIRWTGNFYAPYSGTYTFTTTADDGFRFYLSYGGAQAGAFNRWASTPTGPVTTAYQVALTAGTTYAFTLEYFEDGAGGGQISLDAAAPSAPPSQPLTLSGYASGSSVILNWNADPAATSYLVYRAPQGASSYTLIASYPTNSYTDAAGVPGTNYYYLIEAQNSSGHGPASNALLLAYPAPPPPAYTGYLDEADRNGLNGWAKDSNLPNNTLNVDLYDGMTLFQTVPAANYRGDSSIGYHGFFLPFPDAMIDGNSHTIHARYGGTATELNSSPKTVTVSPSLAVPNFSFESPALNGISFQYTPAGATWAFSGAGIAANAGVFTGGNPSAPDGVQVAFIQGTGTISQSLAGFYGGDAYTVTVAATQRGNNQASSQTVQVSMDGIILGSFTPTGTGYTDYTVNYIAPTTGNHTLTFTGMNPRGGDNTALIDNVRIAKIVKQDFSIDLDINSITLSLTTGTVPGGGPAESMVTAIPYNGFTGAITLSLSYFDASGNSYSGSPGGINYWFDQATDYDPSTGLITIVDTDGQISTFSLCSCQGNPPPGNYTLVITGQTSTLTHSISIPLTITN